MEFLHPWLWPAAFLVAAPVLVHLLSRTRAATIELATFRFLADGYLHQKRRSRLVDLILAGLRAFAVLLMVAVFARPVLHGGHSLWTAGGPGRDVVVIVDASASMNAVAAGASSLERAKSTARSIVEHLADDDRVTVIRAAAMAKRLVHRAGRESGDALAEIDKLTSGPTRGNILAALDEAQAALPDDARAVVYLLTDMQASGWTEMRELAGRRVLRGRRVIVVDCGSTENEANRAVVGRAPRRARAVVGLPLVLRPEVWNASQTNRAEARLSVSIDGEETASFPLVLAPNERQTRDVLITPPRPGIVRGRFEVDRDRFADDDVFDFTLNVAPPVPVLVVRGGGDDASARNNTLFLKAALQANPAGERSLTADAGSDSTSAPTPFLVREVVEGGFTARMIDDAEVVVLVDCGALSPIHMEWLREFVSRGGGLIVLPGDHVKPELYNDAFFPTPGVGGERIIDAQFLAATNSAATTDVSSPGVAFGEVHESHPLMFTFQQPSARFFQGVRVARRFGLKVDNASPTLQTLIAFADGAPAIVEDQYGEGRVLLATFPFDATWSNLPLQPEFAPLVMRMVQFVQRWSHVEVSDAPTPEARVEISAPRRWGRASGEVRDPLDESTWLAFEPQGPRWLAPYDRTSERGVYVARVRGGTTEQPVEGEVAFAINTALEESEFTRVSETDVAAWLAPTEVGFLSLNAAATGTGEVFGEERDLTGWAVLALAGLMVGEFLLATHRNRVAASRPHRPRKR